MVKTCRSTRLILKLEIMTNVGKRFYINKMSNACADNFGRDT